MYVQVPESERRALAHADVMGSQNLSVTFDIWDARPIPEGSEVQRKYVMECALHETHAFAFEVHGYCFSWVL